VAHPELILMIRLGNQPKDEVHLHKEVHNRQLRRIEKKEVPG